MNPDKVFVIHTRTIPGPHIVHYFAVAYKDVTAFLFQFNEHFLKVQLTVQPNHIIFLTTLILFLDDL